MEMGKVPTPNGGLVPLPIFFYSKTIKTGRSRYAVSTELVRRRGGWRENERTVRSFIQSLDEVLVRTKGVSYALN